MKLKKLTRGPLLWILVFTMLLWVGASMLMTPASQRVDTSDGLALLASGQVEQVKITDGTQRVDLTLTDPFVFFLDADGKRVAVEVDAEGQAVDQEAAADLQRLDRGKTVYFFYVDPQGEQIIDAVVAADPQQGHNSLVPTTPWWQSILTLIIPFIIIIALFWFIMNNLQGGNNKAMQFGKSRAKLVNKESPQVTFADVAGVDEALEELEEIKEFLAEPAKFQALGAKIPKGVLLSGPPGTGKTLLARAVAGEAGVPFFTISGSDFVEMFVGVGASRVRDLFNEAKANAPSIIFVDEIDAGGRHRGAGLGGGHDEREQTLNQLLVEMDGFDVKTNVIMIAATNRADILDPALLRPGRFDRQIQVEPPDLRGRAKVLEIHAKGKPMSEDVDLTALARRTPGFTGADLANVLNEAALLTARQNGTEIGPHELDEAIDRVIAGPQKRTRVMNLKEQKITAYHEGGHALVAAALHYPDPVTKVTILPRGRALGYTMVMPTEDKYSTTRNELLDQLAYALGGRVAEELVFHDPSTGASNDIEKATAIARRMVTHYGMSENIGAVLLGGRDSGDFFGRDLGSSREYSEQLAAKVDEEVRKLIENAHTEAWEILVEYRDVLDALVLELLDRETLNQQEIAEVFAPIVKRGPREVWLSHEDRAVSNRPPVTAPGEKDGELPEEIAGTDTPPADSAAPENPGAQQ